MRLRRHKSGVWYVHRTADNGNTTRYSTGHTDIRLARLWAMEMAFYGRPIRAKAWRDTAERLAHRSRSRARRRKLPCSLTPKTVLALLAATDYRCAVTGAPLEPSMDGPARPFQASLDRIDNAQGYTPDNVRVVCLIANFAMHEFGEATLFRLAEHIADNRPTRSPTVGQCWTSIQSALYNGAGEAIRTPDPHLGKVMSITSVVSSDITQTTL